jgi:hypothetical protein
MAIDSIHRFVESPRILVFIDRAGEGAPSGEIAAQAEVIAECEVSANSGLIQDYKVSDSNQGTKASYFASFTWGFDWSENVVLLEDDMILIEDPASFIDASINVFESDNNVGMAVLFANFNHTSTEELEQITNWPIMWGVLLNSHNYSFISSYLAGTNLNDVVDVVSRFARQELKCRFQRVFKSRFEKTWRFKYSRALESRTAWDTQWQFALWGLSIKTLVPRRTLIGDLGVDNFSVSATRVKMEPRSCKSLFKHYVDSMYYCRACESFREIQNFSLPGVLSRNRILNALLLRGLL